jgi:hypothetical protein
LLTDGIDSGTWRLLELAFLAGVGWFSLKQVRRDLNGIGRKIRDERKLEEQRWIAAAFVMLIETPDREERWRIATKLLDSNRGSHGS